MSQYPSMDQEDHHKEMQLLSHNPPFATPSSSSSHPPSWPSDPSPTKFQPMDHHFVEAGPSLDLQLSISVTSMKPPNSECVLIRKVRKKYKDVEALKWQAADQIRLAAMEKAYVERVRELTRREMEMAQSEFARARSMWERAREEVERAEKMKERAVRKIADSTCMEITCQSCRHKFVPY